MSKDISERLKSAGLEKCLSPEIISVVADFDDINNTKKMKKVWLTYFDKKIGPKISKFSPSVLLDRNSAKLLDETITNSLSGRYGKVMTHEEENDRFVVSYMFSIDDKDARGGRREYALICEGRSVMNISRYKKNLREASCEYMAVLSENLKQTRED